MHTHFIYRARPGARAPRRPRRRVLHRRVYYNVTIHNALLTYNGSYSSVVRVSASGGGGPRFNPHHIELSGLEVSPFKISGGSPVHLRSKHPATGSRTWMEDPLGQNKQNNDNNHVLLTYTMVYYIMLCYIMLYYVILYDIILCNVML